VFGPEAWFQVLLAFKPTPRCTAPLNRGVGFKLVLHAFNIWILLKICATVSKWWRGSSTIYSWLDLRAWMSSVENRTQKWSKCVQLHRRDLWGSLQGLRYGLGHYQIWTSTQIWPKCVQFHEKDPWWSSLIEHSCISLNTIISRCIKLIGRLRNRNEVNSHLVRSKSNSAA
jgi:hypothetical protein